MTASLNGKRDHIPLREIDTRDIDVPLGPPVDGQTAVDRLLVAELAELKQTVERLQADVAQRSRPLLHWRGVDLLDLVRWVLFLWVVCYLVIALVEQVQEIGL